MTKPEHIILTEPPSKLSRTLYIGGFPLNATFTNDELQLALFPSATQVRCLMGRVGGPSFAFAEYASHDEALTTMATFLDGSASKTFLGVELSIGWSKEERKDLAVARAQTEVSILLDPPSTDCTTLFLTMLPVNVTEDQIKDKLQATSVRRPGGRAFAFADFSDHDSACRAMINVLSQEGTDSSSPSLELGGSMVKLGWAKGKAAGSTSSHQDECWFCLASKSLKKHLLVSVGQSCYMALPRGGLHPLHVLAIPISCVPSRLHLSKEALTELKSFQYGVLRLHNTHNFSTLIFERALRTKGRDHMQTHFVPIPAARVHSALEAFLNAAAALDLKFFEIADERGVDEVVLTMLGGPYQEYFYIEVPVAQERRRKFVYVKEDDGNNLNDNGKPIFPMHFGIDTAAKAMGSPEKAHWKNNLLDEKVEAQQTASFRELFSKI
jgi:hypothetical protein